MSKRKKTEVKRPPELVALDAPGINWVMLIYFCSGVCSLIDEVVWARLMKLTLGNTVYASSIVVSVFMGGLALGALIMGRYADRLRRPLRSYAILEMCATISALSLPWGLRFADGAYRWFFVRYGASPAGLLSMQIMVSAGLLLVPAMVMGSTLPLLGRYVTTLQDRVGRLVGRLYALNMLGAALGCFLAGFVLIRLVGVMGSLYVAASVNLLVAFGGWTLSRIHDVAREPAPETAAAQLPGTGIEEAEWPRRYVLMLAFFVSGLVSIGYELIWMRSIVFRLGCFTYVFSAVLTLYLVGNVIGAWIASRLTRRLKRPAVGFGVSLTCLGLLGVLYFPLFSGWHLKAAPYVFPLFGGLLEVSAFREVGVPLVHSAFLFLLPAITMGIGFPLALQAWSRYRHKAGRTTGTVYGANTIGAVLGGVVTGFVLIPLAGAQVSITVLGLVAIWLGAMMIQMFGAKVSLARRMGYLAVPVLLSIAAVVIPSDAIGRGLIQVKNSTLVAVKEGVTTTVSVHEVIGADKRELFLAVAAIPIAGDERNIRSAQKTLGHLGVLLNKNAREVLSVGFGSGETTWCLAQHDLQRIDCVEIAPELVQVALKYFRHINLGDELDREVNMLYMDAKNYLHLTDKRYDIIINDADAPSQPGSAPMFAREHFQSALEHLNPGGLFITKLHLTSISQSSFDSILGTFLEVYPHLTVWFPTTRPYIFFYLVGSGQEQLFSPRYVEDELQKENVRKSADYMNLGDNLDLFSWYVGDGNDVRRYLGDFHVNSDYTPFVEFNLGKQDLMEKGFFQQFVETVRRKSLVDHIEWRGWSQDERDQWLKDYGLIYEVSDCILMAHHEEDLVSRLPKIAGGLRLMPQHAALLEQDQRSLHYAKSALDKGLADKILADMNTVLKEQPQLGTAWLIKSWALQRKNETVEALSAGLEAAQHAPHSAAARYWAGALLLRHNQADKAVVHLTEAVRLEPAKATFRRDLGVALWRQNRLDEAISEFREALRLDPGLAKARDSLARALAQQRKLDEVSEGYRQAESLLKQGKIADAVQLAEQTCQRTGYKNPAILDLLAAAYAEAGQFERAVETAIRAHQLALAAGKTQLAQAIHGHLTLYKQGKPLH